MAGHFQLDKWYLDAIREDGSGVILYHAKMRWKWLGLRYYNRLEFDTHGNVRSKVSLFRKLRINASRDEVYATDGRLNGHWKNYTDGFKVTLLENELGSIQWHCGYPNCKVILNKENKDFDASGYAEQLTMTIDPWKFDIRELYWGRFCNEKDSLVWIEWRGEIPRKWLFYNGNAIQDFTLNDSRLSCELFTLDLSNRQVIRTGTLMSTVFRSFRWLQFLLPGKTMFSDETKWCAKATFQSDTHNSSGFSIFEKVIWVK